MPTAALVADALSAWREAERLLDRMPAGSPDHETARLLVTELHVLFVELTEHRDVTADRIEASSATIRQARQLLSGFSRSR